MNTDMAAGRGATADEAVQALYDDIAEWWPGWRMTGDVIIYQWVVDATPYPMFEARVPVEKLEPAELA